MIGILQIFEINNEKQEEEVMEYLNETAKQIYDAELERVMSSLENDLQKVIFLDWWYGNSLWLWNEEKKNHDKAKRYQHVNSHDWEMAHGYIMETISRGMG